MSQYFDDVELADDNPEPRCPVVLLLDTSYSMNGEPIQELSRGLEALDAAIKEDVIASMRVEPAIVTFGGSVKAVDIRSEGSGEIPFDARQAFTTVDGFHPPTLEAEGNTPMGAAVKQGLALLKDRKQILKDELHLDYFRPWMLLITDGKPTDVGWEAAAKEARDVEAKDGVVIFAIGVDQADMDVLAQFSAKREPLKLKGLAFEELFLWLSRSLSAVSRSKLGDQVPLEYPAGWAVIDT